MHSRDLLEIQRKYPNPTDYARIINKLFKEYGKEIVSQHHKMNKPVYYEDSGYPGFLVKEMSDGTKYLIKSTPNRRDKIIRKIQ